MEALTHYTFSHSNILGNGADGQVVSAQTLQGCDVAIKFLSIESEISRELFQAEAHFSRVLSRSVGLPVHDVVITPDLTGAIVYDRAQGDLLDLLEGTPEGHFSVPAAASLFKELCVLVKRMHARQIAHLDLKPENVLIDTKGRLRLCDFARAHQWTSSPRQYDGIFSCVATKEYSSPERFFDQDFDVAAADIFSLGVTLHVLLTGCYPKSDAPLDMSFIKGIDRSCLQLVSWMLHEDPCARPSIKQVLSHSWLSTKHVN